MSIVMGYMVEQGEGVKQDGKRKDFYAEPAKWSTVNRGQA
jgi:hypothetical protein